MSTLIITLAGNVQKHLVQWLLLVLVTWPTLMAGRDGSGAEVWTTIRFPGPARVIFSPDSKLLALQCNDRVEVWDIQSRKRLWAEKGSADPIADFTAWPTLPARFSPDGSLLAIPDGRYPQPLDVTRREADETNHKDSIQFAAPRPAQKRELSAQCRSPA